MLLRLLLRLLSMSHDWHLGKLLGAGMLVLIRSLFGIKELFFDMELSSVERPPMYASSTMCLVAVE